MWTPLRAAGRRGKLLASVLLTAAAAGAQTDPTPVDVPVTAVPITVTSTEADYFVLYVKHEGLGAGLVPAPTGNENDVRYAAVSLTKGKAGSTSLTMTVPDLPATRYKVEKYQIANPADVDGDGKDDLTDPNPLNPAAEIALKDGLNLLSTTTEWNTIEFRFNGFGFFAPGPSYLKVLPYPTTRDVYFINAPTHGRHSTFARAMKLPFNGADVEMDRETGMSDVDADVATYYFWIGNANGAWRNRQHVPLLHSLISANMPIMAAEAAKWRVAYYIPDTHWSVVYPEPGLFQSR